MPGAGGGVAYLLSVCAVMFVGSYASGTLPSLLLVQESTLQKVTALGAGMLIGTALAVIIPEGFAALGEVQGDYPHSSPGVALVAGFLMMLLLDSLQHKQGGGFVKEHASTHGGGSARAPSSQRLVPLTVRRKSADGQMPDDLKLDSEWDGDSARGSPFLRPKAADESSLFLGADLLGALERPQRRAEVHSPAMRALVGLIIHSATDGFAVGTATTSDNAVLSTMVGVAMVLHKAPVAFGLATYLMNAKWSWGKTQQGILAFSLASPAAAILTYTVLRHIPSLSTPLAIALCVIFSGGTFLYAACMHILPEVRGTKDGFTGWQVILITAGCLVPVILSSGHSHGAHSHSHP